MGTALSPLGRAGASVLLVLAILCEAALATDAAVPVVVRVFTLKHRRAEEVVLLVRPLLSDKGSVILQSRLNTVTVRDSAPAVERVAQALTTYDVPPRALSISVSLLRATTGGSTPSPRAASSSSPPPSPEAVSDEIRGVGARLKKLFNFTGYTRVDAVVVQGVEGESVEYALGGDFRLEFLLEPSGNEAFTRLKNLTLTRTRRDASGREVVRPVARTTINLPLGEPFVLGVGRDETASGALFLVFVATSRTALPGPGIEGVR